MVDKSLKCFIAMAFGKEDTDMFFDNLLLPTLITNNIVPVIINRIESNLDLNIQIYNQIRKCDFCIADLTYARPSVYFEAGYAQRNNPVIYTVRKDHLHKGQTENLRVHFDLQMKNLITWDDPFDQSFSSRLEKRIKGTIQDQWLKLKEEESKKAQEEREFLALSVYERLSIIRKTVIKFLKEKGVTRWLAINSHGNVIYPSSELLEGLVDSICSYRILDNKLSIYYLRAMHTLDTSEMSFENYRKFETYKFISTAFSKKITDNSIVGIRINNVRLVLPRVTPKRLESYLPSYKPELFGKVYSNPSSSYSYLFGSKPVIERWTILNDISSNSSLVGKLEEVDSYFS